MRMAAVVVRPRRGLASQGVPTYTVQYSTVQYSTGAHRQPVQQVVRAVGQQVQVAHNPPGRTIQHTSEIYIYLYY